MQTYIVDSFTDRPYTGNPAGVCLPAEEIADRVMLQIAQELGLSETAFVVPIDGGDAYSIRFFSPVMEIPLCGHATLAAAKILFETLELQMVHFVNVEGLDLIARRAGGDIVLEFPVYETEAAEAPPALLKALTLDAVENVVFNKETNILLLEIQDTGNLAALTPDFAALYNSHDSINGVLVTAPSAGDGYDFHSRYFWPWSGTNEDPVTGGTHTFLAKYWAMRLGKSKMRSFQSSRRTGFMQVEVLGDKLLITSQAQIILRGEISV